MSIEPEREGSEKSLQAHSEIHDIDQSVNGLQMGRNVIENNETYRKNDSQVQQAKKDISIARCQEDVKFNSSKAKCHKELADKESMQKAKMHVETVTASEIAEKTHEQSSKPNICRTIKDFPLQKNDERKSDFSESLDCKQTRDSNLNKVKRLENLENKDRVCPDVEYGKTNTFENDLQNNNHKINGTQPMTRRLFSKRNVEENIPITSDILTEDARTHSVNKETRPSTYISKEAMSIESIREEIEQSLQAHTEIVDNDQSVNGLQMGRNVIEDDETYRKDDSKVQHAKKDISIARCQEKVKFYLSKAKPHKDLADKESMQKAKMHVETVTASEIAEKTHEQSSKPNICRTIKDFPLQNNDERKSECPESYDCKQTGDSNLNEVKRLENLENKDRVCRVVEYGKTNTFENDLQNNNHKTNGTQPMTRRLFSKRNVEENIPIISDILTEDLRTHSVDKETQPSTYVSKEAMSIEPEREGSEKSLQAHSEIHDIDQAVNALQMGRNVIEDNETYKKNDSQVQHAAKDTSIARCQENVKFYSSKAKCHKELADKESMQKAKMHVETVTASEIAEKTHERSSKPNICRTIKDFPLQNNDERKSECTESLDCKQTGDSNLNEVKRLENQENKDRVCPDIEYGKTNTFENDLQNKDHKINGTQPMTRRLFSKRNVDCNDFIESIPESKKANIQIESKVAILSKEHNFNMFEKNMVRNHLKEAVKAKLQRTKKQKSKQRKISDMIIRYSAEDTVNKPSKIQGNNDKIERDSSSQEFHHDKMTHSGLSRHFYKSIGVKLSKNCARNLKRKLLPLEMNEDVPIALNRSNSSEYSFTLGNSSNKHTQIVEKTVEYIKDNGPIIKTQQVCSYFNSLKRKTSRIRSCEIIEKLGLYVNITQIYVNGTGYILDGKYQHLDGLIETLGTMCQVSVKETFNDMVYDKLKDLYSRALNSMKDAYDKVILKGILTTLTSPKFMASLDGKVFKKANRNARNMLHFHLQNQDSIIQSSQVVRNDMTNIQQRCLTKRLIERRKIKELRTIYEGRGRSLKTEQFKDLAAVLEFCFGERDIAECAGGGLESHPRLTHAVLYRAVDNNTIMKRAREVILAVAPDDFQISLSACYSYTQNFRAGSHQAERHHFGKNVNANISLHAPSRTGVQQFVANLHWSTANVNLQLDQGEANKNATVIDCKDAKSIVCSNVAPVQKPGKTWSSRKYLDHDWDWDQSRHFAVTPMTHLFLNTTRENIIIDGQTTSVKVTRSGKVISLLNLSYFEPETAFRSLNEILLMMSNPDLQEYFLNPETSQMKKIFLFVVDNGPSEAPSSKIVQMCLSRLHKFLGLEMVCQVSFAEYHSKRNPVERVHAEENRALSRHGPFKLDTRNIVLGSEDHRGKMEEVLKEVSECLSTASFANNNIIALRGSNTENQIFDDEKELKQFLSLSDDQKDSCEASYEVQKSRCLSDLSTTWGVDEDFTGSYIEDFNTIHGQCSWTDKYTTKFFRDTSSVNNLQPLPDFIRWFKTGELHYLDVTSTQKLCAIEEELAWKNTPGLYLPTKILDIMWKISPNLPEEIKTACALLTWLPVKDIETYFGEKKETEMKQLKKDEDLNTWRQTKLYKKRKQDLIKICHDNNLDSTGTKLDIVNRIKDNNITSVEDIGREFDVDLKHIPRSICGINSMTTSTIRAVLHHHGVATAGTKEELVLRLFMLIHRKTLINSKEIDAILNIIDVTKQLIKRERILDIVCLESERKFGMNKLDTTRQSCIKKCISKPVIPVPNNSNLDNLFESLEKFLTKEREETDEHESSPVIECLKKEGSTVKIRWLKHELTGTGWNPGWYSATVKKYTEAEDTLTVEYIQEPGHTYDMKLMEYFSKGMIEPSKCSHAQIELYEGIMTVGKQIEVYWSRGELQDTNWNPGWYQAKVLDANQEEDTIQIEYLLEKGCKYTIEVSPSLKEKTIRLKK